MADELAINYRKLAEDKLRRDYRLLTVGEKWQLLGQAMVERKHQIPVVSNWDIHYFMWFLYDTIIHPDHPPEREEVPKPKQDATAEALGWIAKKDSDKVKPAVPELIRALDDPDTLVKANAIRALRIIGKGDAEAVRSAVPSLIKAMSDSKGEVRGNAAWAIGINRTV